MRRYISSNAAFPTGTALAPTPGIAGEGLEYLFVTSANVLSSLLKMTFLLYWGLRIPFLKNVIQTVFYYGDRRLLMHSHIQRILLVLASAAIDSIISIADLPTVHPGIFLLELRLSPPAGWNSLLMLRLKV